MTNPRSMLWADQVSGPPSGVSLSDPNAPNGQGVFTTNQFAPSGTLGCLAATYDRAGTPANAAATAATSGTLRLHRIFLPAGLKVATITFWSGTTALVAGVNQWFGLFDQNRNVLAKTVDDGAAAWGASTRKGLAISGGFFLTTYSGWYYVGMVVVAGTVPTIESLITLATGSRTEARIPAGNSTAGLTTPASCTGQQTAITPVGVLAYCEIS